MPLIDWGSCLERIEATMRNTRPLVAKYMMRSTITLVPIPISRGVYKVVQMPSALMDPRVAPCYTLVSHGIGTHTYSLLADPAPDTREQGQVVFPLSVYTTTTNRRYATILDLPPKISSVIGLRCRDPSEIRLGFHKDFGINGHMEFETLDGRKFVWQRHSPPGTDKKMYYLHMVPSTDSIISVERSSTAIPGLDPIPDVTDRDAVQPSIPIAREVKSPFKNPIDGFDSLWGIEIDRTQIDPVVAFMTCFAGMTSRTGPSLTSSLLTSARFDPSAQLLNEVNFVDVSRQTYSCVGQRITSTNSASDNSDKENSDDLFRGDNGTSNETGTSRNKNGKHTNIQQEQGPQYQTCEVKVFDRNYLKKLAIPGNVLENLSAEGTLYMEFQRNRWNLT